VLQNPAVNIIAIRNSCAKITFCSSGYIFMFPFAGSNISDASEHFVSRIQLSFAHFAFIQLHKQKSNRV